MEQSVAKSHKNDAAVAKIEREGAKAPYIKTRACACGCQNERKEAVEMLSGEFRHSIDPKNRLFIPAKHREELAHPTGN